MAKEFKYYGYDFTEEDIRRAMAHTRSNAEAARYMKVGITTYQRYAKKYIDVLTGKSLWELHMNISSKGIPKKWVTGELKGDLDKMLTENQLNNPKRLGKLKALLMKDGRIGYCCGSCGYSQRRLTDMKLPLMLMFKNGVRNDWRIENLDWVCYNCAFILGLDYFSNRMIRDIESFSNHSEERKEELKEFYQLDEFYLDYIDGLTLDSKGNLTPKPAQPDQNTTEDFNDLIDIK